MKHLAIIVLFIALLSACQGNRVTMSKSMADSIVSVNIAADTSLTAIQLLQKVDEAEKFYQAVGDRRGIGNSLVKRAVLYFAIGQSADALEQVNKARPYIADLDSLTLLFYYRAHAILLTERNLNAREAEKDMLHAISLSTATNDSYRKAVDMGNLAELYIRQGRIADARRIIEELEPLTEGKPAGYQVQMDYCIGLIHSHEGKLDSAYSDFQRCFRQSKEWNVPSLEISALKELSHIDSVRNDYRAFSFHYPLYIQIQNKVMGQQAVDQMNLIKARHAMEQMEMQHREEKLSFALLLILAVVVVVSLAILAWLLVRRNRQNQQIARLTKEQMENKMHTQSLEKELLELKLQKGKTQIETMQREKAAVSVQLAAIEGGQSDGKQVRNYANILERLDPAFTNELQRICPTISKSELRMASLIKLGMDAAEMADVLHISTASLYTLRYRLRKRLALKQDESLENFIKGLGNSKKE